MKIKSAILATLVLLAASSPIMAKKYPPRPFFLPTAVSMEGAEIPAGVYQLTMESDNSGLRVSLWREGHFIATARGAWVKSGVKFAEDTALLRVNSDGSRSLIEIRIAGSTKTIVLKNPNTTIQYSEK